MWTPERGAFALLLALAVLASVATPAAAAGGTDDPLGNVTDTVDTSDATGTVESGTTVTGDGDVEATAEVSTDDSVVDGSVDRTAGVEASTHDDRNVAVSTAELTVSTADDGTLDAPLDGRLERVSATGGTGPGDGPAAPTATTTVSGATTAAAGTGTTGSATADAGTRAAEPPSTPPTGRTPTGVVAAPPRAGVSNAGDVPAGPGAAATGTAGVAAVALGTMVGTGPGIERELAQRVSDRLERLVRLVAPFRYSRHDDSDPLDHEVRAAIHDHVTEHPGTYVSALGEAVDVSTSTVRHHLRILEREGLVEDAHVLGRRRLFPAGVDHPAVTAALADETTADVMLALARHGPCGSGSLAEELDTSPSTVSHHLSRLEEAGVVVREDDGRATRNRLSSAVDEALSTGRGGDGGSTAHAD
jgi:DNA-binding transcriptional ArsR family regulator